MPTHVISITIAVDHHAASPYMFPASHFNRALVRFAEHGCGTINEMHLCLLRGGANGHLYALRVGNMQACVQE